MSRAQTTVLLITPELLARADFSGGKVTRHWEDYTPPVAELPTQVDLLLKAHGKPGKKIWVLASEIWTQQLDIERTSVGGLRDAEIGRALAFEAESLAGISPFDSALAFHRLGGDGQFASFWISTIRASIRGEIEDIARNAGGKLEGLVHPGGLSASIGGHTGNWVRCEHWNDVVLGVKQEGSSRQVRLWELGVNRESWKSQWDEWRGSPETHPASEELFQSGQSGTMAVPDAAEYHLADVEGLHAFLDAWGRALAAGNLELPVITPPPRPISNRQRGMVATGLAAVAAFVCVAHYTIMQARVNEMSERRIPLAERAEESRALENQISGLTEREVLLEAQLHTLEQQAVFLDLQKVRLQELLRTLRENAGGDIVLDRIVSDGTEVRLHGVSLKASGANELERELSESLLPFGWRVLPPGKSALQHRSDGGPWRFELPLRWSEAPAATADDVLGRTDL